MKHPHQDDEYEEDGCPRGAADDVGDEVLLGGALPHAVGAVRRLSRHRVALRVQKLHLIN